MSKRIKLSATRSKQSTIQSVDQESVEQKEKVTNDYSPLTTSTLIPLFAKYYTSIDSNQIVLQNNSMQSIEQDRDSATKHDFDIIGREVLTASDKNLLKQNPDQYSFLYGEVLERGADKMFDKDHLDLLNASVVCDLGAGLGKLAIQAFLQFPHLKQVIAVELSKGRWRTGMNAIHHMLQDYNALHDTVQFTSCTNSHDPSKSNDPSTASCSTCSSHCFHLQHCTVKQFSKVVGQKRSSTCLDEPNDKSNNSSNGKFTFWQGDLFQFADKVVDADVVILETNFPSSRYVELCELLNRLKSGVRVMTYLSLHQVYRKTSMRNPFRLMCPKTGSDILTTWRPVNGFEFFFWTKP